jgi:hypothetical protein
MTDLRPVLTRIAAALGAAMLLSGPVLADDAPPEIVSYRWGLIIQRAAESCEVQTTGRQRSALTAKMTALKGGMTPEATRSVEQQLTPNPECPSAPKDREQFAMILSSFLDKAPRDFAAFIEAGPPAAAPQAAQASPLASPLAAMTAQTGGLIKSVRIEAFAAALRDKGYKAEVVASPGQESYIRTGFSGRPVTIGFTDCQAGSCGSYIFRTYLSNNPKFTLKTANTWNREKRYSKASLDSDNDPALEWELDMSAGVGPDYIKATIDSFESMAGDFAKAQP